MSAKRTMTIRLSVTVPAEISESAVEQAIDAALDEPPCDWGDWFVSGVSIVKVELDDNADDDDDFEKCED